MKVNFILSGTVRKGNVGEPTTLKDMNDTKLFVGDIVAIMPVDEFGVKYFAGLTVVVSDRWTSYSDGTHIAKTECVKHYIMGLIDVDVMSETSGWYVKLVKSHKDVIAGEHWSDYGFNYTNQ